MNYLFPELWVLIAMVGTFLFSAFALRWPVALALVGGALAGCIVGGEGFPLRHFVEGTLVYLDTIVLIASAMVFMRGIQANGLLEWVAYGLAKTFRRYPATLLVLITWFAMSAGMITGSSTATILTTGAIAAPVLYRMGLSRQKTGALLALSGLLGMVAPPVNIPAMIIGGGVDMPYIGFELPLAVLSFPLAAVIALSIGIRSVRSIASEELKAPEGKPSLTLFFPVLLLLILIFAERAFPRHFPGLGLPLDFIIASLATPFCGRRINPLRVTREAINDALPIMGILVGVGVFLEVMTMTGVRGFVVDLFGSLPEVFFWVGVAISLPLFGAVSAFGSASILGVPFLLALLGRNEIIVASGLSLLSALGDLVPPTALAGLFAAQVVQEPRYLRVLKNCLPQALLIDFVGIAFMLWARPFESFIFHWPTLPRVAVLLAGTIGFVLFAFLVDLLRRRRWGECG